MQRSVAFRLAFLLFVAGLAACSAPKETAVVVERVPRPEKPPSTEDAVPAARTRTPLTPFPAGYDTVRARPFDSGKMWTFDNPPLDYFAGAYGFRPDSAWLARARLAALRFGENCSAGFVSPHGLVMTNHHCAREHVSAVNRPGEALLEKGFYARRLEDERRVEGLYVDQLVAIEDVTRRVGASERMEPQMRQRLVEALQQQMTAAAKARDTTLLVQIIPLYNGGKYSAYTFRRYRDVRLVMVPELRLGFFGGAPDNFAYPRYTLDVAFFRVYDPGGRPLSTDNYFPWSTEGAKEGEVVFAIGNPGQTSRLSTVSQLKYERDYGLPQRLAVLQRRAEILADYIRAHPEEADRYHLHNPYFSILNSLEAFQGQLDGLRNPYLIARRTAAERALQAAVFENDSLRAHYGDVWEQIELLQKSKQATSEQARALLYFGNPSLSSHVLTRALYGYVHDLMQQRAFPPERIQAVYDEGIRLKDWPRELEAAFVAQRLKELLAYLGPNDPTMKKILGDQSPDSVAAHLVARTALVDSAAFRAMLDKRFLRSGDPVVPLIEAIAPLYFTLNQQLENFQEREKMLNGRLARARFAVFGTDFPPDASFSLRLSDGVVRGYPYNGTKAPPFTTFYGLYARHHAFFGRPDWMLPELWLAPHPDFDPETPLNLVSTNDIAGGSSGSPLVNRDLQIVGVVFDGNAESLPNRYLYTDEQARTISVDARGILEALDDVYEADRLVAELRSGRLVPSEAEAALPGRD
ncbi:MAG: hypothetical protein KatS3mg043_0239 [Rhodothermaceae bacterium]|nr:MAG: hypothetical protein KatS3mg043_0239 [Rhodothermaceae bacterium]